MTFVDDNLREALRSLLPGEREAVRLSISGLTTEEIGRRLSLGPEQVQALISRALRSVRRKLKRLARSRPQTRHKWLH
jgi:DNA-directed RNA polymerase specialized sigma24 family protein